MPQPNASPPLDLNLCTVSTIHSSTYEEAVRYALLAQELASGGPGYPIQRSDQVSARIDPKVLLERLAMREGWQAQRPDAYTLIARMPGAFVVIAASGKPSECLMSFGLWAANSAVATALETELLGTVADCRLTEARFHLDWRFRTGDGTRAVTTVERFTDVLQDEAYPNLSEGVAGFIEGYLDAPESVLLLQGPPGSGKTRLIRAILSAMSDRKTDTRSALALYSGDPGIWGSDEVFVDFITGYHDALLIEDADLLLVPRSDGNEAMHRFLNIADGVARARGRKILFSTNLPNVRDIDPALVRPGRCFAHLVFRELTIAEAGRLLERLSAGDPERAQASMRVLERVGVRKGYSVAEVYAAYRSGGATTTAVKRMTAVRSVSGGL